jgi:hypothetical protein
VILDFSPFLLDGFVFHRLIRGPRVLKYGRNIHGKKNSVSAMPSAPIYLGVLWGHLPRGFIRTTRNICRKDEGAVPFCLARRNNTGKQATTVFNSLGNYHLDSSMGPFPVSLVEMISQSSSAAPVDFITKLHCISIGFPVAGEREFSAHEKFYNPVVRPPADPDVPLMLTELISADGRRNDTGIGFLHRLSQRAIRPCDIKSSLVGLDSFITGAGFDGETSDCDYINHPHARHVRNDRGKVRGGVN